MELRPKSNIANKVRNTNLPKTKPLMPLFEVISNSIHAINEAKKADILKGEGEIRIKVIRNGDQLVLQGMENIDSYPVKSFEIKDNGIGLNDENLNYFVETDTDHKIEIGGKGVGRFVCLKAFKKLLINSCYKNGEGYKVRAFEFTNTKEGFHDFSENNAEKNRTNGTKIILSEYKEEYQKFVPRPLSLIAKEIIIHFQLYFIKGDVPVIIIENQNNDTINCKTYFEHNFQKDIESADFYVGDYAFTMYLTKSVEAQSHKLNFCAHNRSVKEEGLSTRIIDLGKYSISNDQGNYYYQAFIVGEVLDENVDLERIGFFFPSEEDESDLPEIITLAKIRREAIATIEIMLNDYLTTIREKKISKYKPTIHDELPQYNYLLNHKIEEIKRLPPDLSKQKLDIELYKLETEWKTEVKQEVAKILEEKKDIQNLDEYKVRYEKFLEEFNEVGKSDLARYVVHRRSVIDLLEKLLEKNEDDKFSDEEVLHSIFFPIRSASDEVPYDKQNLWLIDERLTYHTFLASDKKFEQIKQLESTNNDRTDLLIYNDALAFSEGKLAPFPSFTIVEFKKPQRDGYRDNDPTKNPLDQVEKYIKELLAGKVVSRGGRKIHVDSKIPFYVYIVCDITDSLKGILESREFDKTPDGMGYFKFYTRYYNAYIEVLPFEKVLTDAKKRNRILFEKLGLSQ
ncbi:MAG: ATP-binding protein [Chitinophagaceae bacterium BSSC1]|nr:MAG: ATP-binding protein [Chitinophagaceae bacterium BSSC1]